MNFWINFFGEEGRRELRDIERGGGEREKRERDKEGEVARLRVAKIKKKISFSPFSLSPPLPLPPTLAKW